MSEEIYRKAKEFRQTFPISEVCIKLSQMKNICDEGYNYLLDIIEDVYKKGLLETAGKLIDLEQCMSTASKGISEMIFQKIEEIRFNYEKQIDLLKNELEAERDENRSLQSIIADVEEENENLFNEVKSLKES